MSRSFNQSHPLWKSKASRSILKFKKTKMKPYGMHAHTNYGNEYFKKANGGELLFTCTTKNKERRNNKLNIYQDYE